VRGQLGDLQASELADDVGFRLSDVDAIREVGAELVFQRQHGGGTTQLEDSDRVLLLHEGHDGHFGRDLADR
jgi:hypothetical protein